jgi:hypothetical protein
LRIPRRQFLAGTLGLLAAGRVCAAGGDKAGPAGFLERSWRLDPVCVLPRGPQGSYDARVAGDPCIVWDEERRTWRMFYFASGHGSGTALAFSRSEERIGPGDWEKAGQPELANPEALVNRRNWHKWWVVQDLDRSHRAARIEGRYWALMVSARQQPGQRERKHIQVAHADRLAGPWTIVAQPILAPEPGFLDGLHCDTPSAFWMPEQQRVAIFYKGYPLQAQEQQGGSRFGSGTILAYWHPRDATARKMRILLRPGVNDTWLKGWISTPQIFFDAERRRWYGLINGSPTPPADESHREPAPSLGGWVVCDGPDLEGPWRPDTEHSPFRRPEQLTKAELEAGLGVNFWRHHLLATSEGQARIYFNSGSYGREQMYSLVAGA